MIFSISGKQIDVGEALQEHVRVELGEVAKKYAERPTRVVVVFSKNAHEFVAEATVHLSTGLTAQARGQKPDVYAAFDACAEKMEKQLRRYKRRLKDHHNTRTEPVELLGGSSYVLASSVEEEPETSNLEPIIIAETETNIPELSVGEAVMQLEIAEAPVLLFRNQKEGRLNVVYHREDGNIGWIDPSE